MGWVMAVVMGVVVKVQRALRTAKATAWEKGGLWDVRTNQVVRQVSQSLRRATSEGA